MNRHAETQSAPPNPKLGYALMVAGLIPLGLALHAVWQWQRVQKWEPVPAIMQETQFETHTSTGAQGNSSSSTRLVATYHYIWNGTEHAGTGICPFNHIELYTEFKRSRHAALLKAREQQTEITCYVNPARTTEAVLYREFRGWTFAAFLGFALMFSGCGFLVVRGKPEADHSLAD